MHQGELTHGLVELLGFALFVKKGILVLLLHEEVKLEITPLHLVAHKRPFAKDNRLAVGGSIGEGVALHDVTAEQMKDWARMMEIEFIHITKDSTPDKIEEQLFLNDLAWKLR